MRFFMRRLLLVIPTFGRRLTDVFPNGFSMHLTEGIIRGRYHRSLETPELLEPEKVYEFKIDLWVTSNLFLKGHKIRLDVSEQLVSEIRSKSQYRARIWNGC